MTSNILWVVVIKKSLCLSPIWKFSLLINLLRYTQLYARTEPWQCSLAVVDMIDRSGIVSISLSPTSPLTIILTGMGNSNSPHLRIGGVSL